MLWISPSADNAGPMQFRRLFDRSMDEPYNLRSFANPLRSLPIGLLMRLLLIKAEGHMMSAFVRIKDEAQRMSGVG